MSSAALPEQLGLFCQRWNRGRASYRPAGEPFDTRRASVEEIDERDAKAYVLTHHYSSSYPAARFRAGLFIKQPFGKAALSGVAVFSVPMTQAVVPAYFPDLAPARGVELGRLVLCDSAEANAESWMIARAFRLLRAKLPTVQGVLAYCDPVERRDEAGALVKRGHVGTIYKASNAAYRGMSSARTLWLAPNGACLSERLLSKIRLGESGERYAFERLAKLGAPTREFAEDGAEFVARLKTERWLRPVRHPGNLAFTWRFR